MVLSTQEYTSRGHSTLGLWNTSEEFDLDDWSATASNHLWMISDKLKIVGWNWGAALGSLPLLSAGCRGVSGGGIGEKNNAGLISSAGINGTPVFGRLATFERLRTMGEEGGEEGGEDDNDDVEVAGEEVSKDGDDEEEIVVGDESDKRKSEQEEVMVRKPGELIFRSKLVGSTVQRSNKKVFWVERTGVMTTR